MSSCGQGYPHVPSKMCANIKNIDRIKVLKRMKKESKNFKFSC